MNHASASLLFFVVDPETDIYIYTVYKTVGAQAQKFKNDVVPKRPSDGTVLDEGQLPLLRVAILSTPSPYAIPFSIHWVSVWAISQGALSASLS